MHGGGHERGLRSGTLPTHQIVGMGEVTVADIIIAVDEPLDATQCGGKENCHGADAATGARCMTHELWATLNEKMVDYLDSVSLQDLVDQQKHKSAEQNVVVMHRNNVAVGQN